MRGAFLAFALGTGCVQQSARLMNQQETLWVCAGAAVCLLMLLGMSQSTPASTTLSTRIPTITIITNQAFSYWLMRKLCELVCATLLGGLWASYWAHSRIADRLSPHLEGRDLILVGTINDLPQPMPNGVRFVFKPERALGEVSNPRNQNLLATQALSPEELNQLKLPEQIYVSWYAAFRAERDAAWEELQTVPSVSAGERWQLTLRLRRPRGNANPDTFDYELWLLQQNIGATAYVRADDKNEIKNQRLQKMVGSFSAGIARVREATRARIMSLLLEKRYAGVLAALVMGDQRAIAQEDWRVFNRTGIGHLVSISGLHITMIAALAFALMQALWRRSFFIRTLSKPLPLRLPTRKAAALAGALTALLYTLLAGGGVPAQRTLYMLCVVAAALWCARVLGVSQILCLALGVVVLFDPWAVLAPGFWLSFTAVAVIVYASARRAHDYHRTDARQKEVNDVVQTDKPIEMTSHAEKPRARAFWAWWTRLPLHIAPILREATRTQWAVTLGLIPLTLLLFGQFSLVSPLANAIAIPLVSWVITPLALLATFLPQPLAQWGLLLAHQLFAGLAQILNGLSSGSHAVWQAMRPDFLSFALASVGVLWLLAPRGVPVRWLGMVLCLPLLLQPVHVPKQGVWLTAFDVGQGMALLVETAQHRLLYDTGPAYSPDSDGGNRVIVPYLRARGIHKLEAVVVSHHDNDHSGGALSVFDEMTIDWVASSLSDNHPARLMAPEHRSCYAGQQWTWGEGVQRVQFEVLHPTWESYSNPHLKTNARSCTVRIQTNEHSVLLAGDIERAQEQELLLRYRQQPEKLRAEILLMPHHGSLTSSSNAFIDAVAPKVAIVQAGYLNRFGHPKSEVLERYRTRNIAVEETSRSGALQFDLSQAQTVLTRYREQAARYWRD